MQARNTNSASETPSPALTPQFDMFSQDCAGSVPESAPTKGPPERQSKRAPGITIVHGATPASDSKQVAPVLPGACDAAQSTTSRKRKPDAVARSPAAAVLHSHFPLPSTTTPQVSASIDDQRAVAIDSPQQDIDDFDCLERHDGNSDIHLHYSSRNECPESILAKMMIQRMMWDISDKRFEQSNDLLGMAVSGKDEVRRLDALIWMFGLHPEPPIVHFEWCCRMIELDCEAMRRIAARSVKDDLRRILDHLAKIVDYAFARQCALALADYISLHEVAEPL